MPALPEGEADLQGLALEFVKAETFVMTLVALAANGRRRESAKSALDRLTELRKLSLSRAPAGVLAAYLHEHPQGRVRDVRRLQASLAKALDDGVRTAAESARAAFKATSPDNVQQLAAVGLTAYVNKAGARVSLTDLARERTTTLGRVATSWGVRDGARPDSTISIEVSGCAYCTQFEGEFAFADVPGWPPFHPSCGCVASVA